MTTMVSIGICACDSEVFECEVDAVRLGALDQCEIVFAGDAPSAVPSLNDDRIQTQTAREFSAARPEGDDAWNGSHSRTLRPIRSCVKGAELEIAWAYPSAFDVAMRVTSQRRVPASMKAKNVGERLRAIRESNNLSPSQMADLLGVERTYWTRWEKGHRPIPTPEAAKLTEMFEVDLDYILVGNTKSVPAEVQAALRAALSRTPPEA